MADGTQYLIDIAARMSGGDAAVSQLVMLADRLGGAGTASEQFERAIAQTKSALEAAQGASQSAAEALSQGERKYRQLEIAAVNAAKALEKAQLKGTLVPAELVENATKAASALKAEAVAVDALREKSAAAAKEQERLKGALENLNAAGKQSKKLDDMAAATARGSGNLKKLAAGLGDISGPFAPVTSQVFAFTAGIGDLTEALGTGPGGLVAAVVVAVAAIAALVIGVGTAIIKTAQWGVELADLARTERLATEALGETSDALANLGEILPGITRETGLAADDLRSLAKQLDGAKVSADDMPRALQAIALAEKALGKGGAAKFIEQLKSGKKSARELAAELNQKFGGIVAKQMLSLDEQTKTLKRNLGETFGGLEIEPLLEGMKTLVNLFDQNTESGKTLKFIFEGLFQPLIDGIAKAAPVAEAFFLGMLIAALKLFIAFKPAIKAIGELFGKPDVALGDALQLAVFLGKQLVIAILAVSAVIALLLSPVIAFGIGLGKLAIAGVQAWNQIKAGAEALKGFLQSVSLADIGRMMIEGLAGGIRGAASTVVSAITGVVKGAVSAAKGLLGISSPSKLFMDIGANTAAGFAGGVEDESGGAQSALAAMVDPPAPSASPAAAATGARAAGASVNLAGATFNFYGVKDADDAEARITALWTRLLEGDALSLGGGEAVAT